MTDKQKRVLVVAKNDKVEALRMATGLTLLDDAVRVALLGDLDKDDAEVQLQLESLEFADVPVEELSENAMQQLAEMIIQSDSVLMV